MSIVSGRLYVEPRWYYILKSDLDLSLATFSSHSFEEHNFIGIADEEHQSDIESFSDKDLEKFDTSWINLKYFYKIPVYRDIQEFINEKHTEELSYLETSLKPATKLAEVSKNTHLEYNTTTRENIINTINRDAKEGHSESDFLLPNPKAEPSWSNAHTSVDMYLYIKDNESFTEELKNMGYRVFKSNPSVPTPYIKSERMSAYTIQWGK